MTEAPEAVGEEWRRRVIAEYGSAGVTHSLLGWFLRLGASPTLLHQATRIVDDELVNAEKAFAVLREAGGGNVELAAAWGSSSLLDNACVKRKFGGIVSVAATREEQVSMQRVFRFVATSGISVLLFLGCKNESGTGGEQQGASGESALEPRAGSNTGTGGAAMGCTDCPEGPGGSATGDLVNREQLCMPYDGVGLGFPPPDPDCTNRECADDCDPCLDASSCDAEAPAYACNLWKKCVPVLE